MHLYSFRIEKKNPLHIYIYIYIYAASNKEQVLEATLHKAPTVRPPTSLHENYQS